MSPRRGAFLLLGLATLAVASSPWLEELADRDLAAHMVQHVLLLGVAPPLLLLGEPFRLALGAMGPRRARSLLRLLHSAPLRLLLSPGFALGLFAAVVALSHWPPFYDAALASPPLHLAEHGAYLLAGLVFWSVPLAADPTRKPPSPVATILLLLAAMPPMIAVGVLLASSPEVLYDHYLGIGGEAAALAGQRSAATAMWAGNLPFSAALVLIGWAALQREERRQRVREAAPLRAGRQT